MTANPADLLALAHLLDKNFELVADTYADAIMSGAGLEEVIEKLTALAGQS